MKALVVHGRADISLDVVDNPRLRAGHVLVRPVLVGMCGTDLEIIGGTIDPAYVSLPVVLGHEWAGVVAESGEARLPVGLKVVVEGVVPCRDCAECTAGRTNLCLNYDEVGFTRDGAAAEFLLAPASLVHRLEDWVSFESGVLVEPAAVVFRALDRVQPRPGCRILVVGDGTVGLLAVRIARLWSPARVDILGAREAQRVLATSAGADTFATRSEDLAGQYDLVVEAAGAVSAAETALAAVVRGGTLVMLGLAGNGVMAALPIDDVVNNDVTIMGSFSYTTEAWGSVVKLLNARRLDFDFVVTHAFDLAEWQVALQTLRDPAGAARGKVLLRIYEPSARVADRVPSID